MPDARFYIHVDANTADATFAQMQAAAPRAQWAVRQPCRWGGFSLVEATLKLINMALADSCDCLVLLSGQDYPVKHPDQIALALAQSPFAAHLDLQPDFDVAYRWQAWHFEACNNKAVGRLLKIQRLAHWFGIRRALPAPLTAVHAGSQWWMLSAPTARTLLDFLAAHPQIAAFFKTTFVPDEMFFQTALRHLLPATQIGPALHQIEWEAGSWSPKSFAPEDAARLVAGPALLARKFGADGATTAAIDRLLDRRGRRS